MSIQLRKIEKFEKDVVDFIKKHPEAYNGVENLTEGVAVPKELYLYNICDGEQTVGFFEIIKVGKDDNTEKEEFEIEIGVYNPRRGYARDCLNRFRELTSNDIDWNDKIILANIELSNRKNFAVIKNLLTNAGFQNTSSRPFNFSLEVAEN